MPVIQRLRKLLGVAKEAAAELVLRDRERKAEDTVVVQFGVV